MVFNIGNQQAGQINMAGRDQYNYGGQHGSMISVGEARDAALALRAALEAAHLPPAERAELRHEAAQVERELTTPDPDRERVAGRLERMTRTLGRLGALAGAGASLIGPLTVLGHWLGPAGATLLGLLR